MPCLLRPAVLNQSSFMGCLMLEEYTEWQQSWVSNEILRDNIIKARDMTIENCLSHVGLFFFVKHGVKVGAARRFVRDIGLWVKRRGEVTCSENTSNSV
ncbi:uncharacterized protein N7479_004113 [Penicillium vulpinum]|uniref:uncharacterized protein n=1 Tax=Penicillium vulpinum TaxID=29845 RepID=UPI002546683B|nr:uncharacterized protein N7479_004113 [Penicillium vulpinum]KAJ5964237.1 hypothetical protein N7479_004113 [Penicillium vulpinum]